MGRPKTKTFDCVQNVREIRDRISGEIADLSSDELVQWFLSHHYADPFLQRLSEKAARQAAANAVARRRRVVKTWGNPGPKDH